MRVSALNKFKKLWGKVNQKLNKGSYLIEV